MASVDAFISMVESRELGVAALSQANNGTAVCGISRRRRKDDGSAVLLVSPISCLCWPGTPTDFDASFFPACAAPVLKSLSGLAILQFIEMTLKRKLFNFHLHDVLAFIGDSKDMMVAMVSKELLGATGQHYHRGRINTTVFLMIQGLNVC